MPLRGTDPALEFFLHFNQARDAKLEIFQALLQDTIVVHKETGAGWGLDGHISPTTSCHSHSAKQLLSLPISK